MPDGKAYTQSDFTRIFNNLARHKHRYEVFRDFVTISAISLHNAVKMDDILEQEYFQIIKAYKKEELLIFSELLAILIELLEPEPRDVLGTLYMDLELGNETVGQFFTPPDVSHMMAQMLYRDKMKKLDKDFITLSEPASGAGGMILAFTKVMLSYHHNPADKLWVQCIDVDRLAALMCYVQLSLWNVPAEIVVGNTLSLEIREVFYTPAHYLYGWDMKLHCRQAKKLITESALPQEVDEPEVSPLKPKQALKGDDLQFDFGF